ncbi:MAG TPA: hypothetical protein PKZ97_09430 [Azospirillaceae bacterium]|nr:hypothetical protein [Azospirillaceae bacterium]HRQ81327.1 hypothetical protein [Azospirillaceae bacterium]
MHSRSAPYRAHDDEIRLYDRWILRDFGDVVRGAEWPPPPPQRRGRKMLDKLLTLLVLILEIIKLLLEHFLGQ